MYLLVLCGVLALWAVQCHGACSPEVKGVNQTSIQIILERHNFYRAQVANGQQKNPDLPQAANMLQLIWDPKVAEKAQKWAEKCTFEHDTPADRDTGRGYTGQNIAEGFNQAKNPDWPGIVKLFYDEVYKNFSLPSIDKFEFDENTGHFTQVIWAKTLRVGCGYVRFKYEQYNAHLYGCNYLPGGNFKGQPIYIKGPPASQCNGKVGTVAGLCAGS